jgi:hypothetical protein
MATVSKLYSYDFKSAKTYLFAAAFIAGNIILPQLAHLIPQGGLMLLPIYFFTLIAAYKYGLKVGLLTALLSPVVNNLLFGMPPLAVLPIILIKSALLATAAALLAQRFGKISIVAVLLAVVTYQLAGTLVEWAILQDFNAALQDIRIGFPGILLQIFGGYAVLKGIEKL